MADRYRLRVNITIERVHGETGSWSGDLLTVSEESDIEASTFLECAEILGKFHTLTETIK